MRICCLNWWMTTNWILMIENCEWHLTLFARPILVWAELAWVAQLNLGYMLGVCVCVYVCVCMCVCVCVWGGGQNIALTEFSPLFIVDWSVEVEEWAGDSVDSNVILILIWFVLKLLYLLQSVSHEIFILEHHAQVAVTCLLFSL